MLETRVEDLIEDYMRHYEADFDEAIAVMMEDLEDALKDSELRKDLT